MTTQALTLARYRAICRELPRPTDAEIRDFALFVSQAHSWYKRTSLLPPGMPLQFFLDPSAGMQRIMRPNGRVVSVVREEAGFHHSWLPTAKYRERFGHLAFCDVGGGGVELHRSNGEVHIGADTAPVVADPANGQLRDVPRSVLRAGRAHISGLVHVGGASFQWWNIVFDRGYRVNWPEEVGGPEALQHIRERSEYLRDNFSLQEGLPVEEIRTEDDVNKCLIDMPLYRLIEPERNRQLAGMAAAMRRVIALIWDQPSR